MLSSQTFLHSLQENCLWKTGRPVLAAVSGGLDSVVLAHLLSKCNIPFAIAHVNYRLRGDESDADENFTAALAKQLQVPFYLLRCTNDELKNTGENSVQAAARKIRYDFFEKTASAQGFLHIAVAHHADDNIETVLLNLARGTGIAGMTGMDFQNGKIIRPLLAEQRTSLIAYAEKEKLQWREDSSNAADDYTRNKFRHHLLPWLLSEIPQGYKGFESSMQHFRQTEKMLAASVENWKAICCSDSGNEIRISIETALKFPEPFLFLSEFLRNYGFNSVQTDAVRKMIAGESGSQLIAESYRLIRDRDSLILVSSNEAVKKTEADFIFSLEEFNGEISKDPYSAIVDEARVKTKLTVRKWKAGDRMVPFGMNGHRNVSDILTDMKVPLHEKENTFVVVSGEEIVWIPGFRIADQFRVTSETKKIWRIKLKQS